MTKSQEFISEMYGEIKDFAYTDGAYPTMWK